MTLKSLGKLIHGIRNKLTLFLTLCILVLLGFSVFSRYKIAVLENKLSEYEITYPLESRNIGYVYDTKQFSFSLNSVRYDQTNIPELPLPQGMMYLVVSYSLHNKLGREAAYLPVFETVIVDENGEEYQVITAPSITMESAAGNIPSGGAVRGELGFLVPSVGKKFIFRYEPRAFPNSNTILYDIRR